jgi:large subunit ribosomal protein L29
MLNQELLDKTDEQLNNLLLELDKDLFGMKNELAVTRKLEKPHLLKEKKKTKARILTILTQRKLEIQNGKK